MFLVVVSIWYLFFDWNGKKTGQETERERATTVS